MPFQFHRQPRPLTPPCRFPELAELDNQFDEDFQGGGRDRGESIMMAEFGPPRPHANASKRTSIAHANPLLISQSFRAECEEEAPDAYANPLWDLGGGGDDDSDYTGSYVPENDQNPLFQGSGSSLEVPRPSRR